MSIRVRVQEINFVTNVATVINLKAIGHVMSDKNCIGNIFSLSRGGNKHCGTRYIVLSIYKCFFLYNILLNRSKNLRGQFTWRVQAWVSCNTLILYKKNASENIFYVKGNLTVLFLFFVISTMHRVTANSDLIRNFFADIYTWKRLGQFRIWSHDFIFSNDIWMFPM